MKQEKNQRTKIRINSDVEVQADMKRKVKNKKKEEEKKVLISCIRRQVSPGVKKKSNQKESVNIMQWKSSSDKRQTDEVK